MWIDFSTFKDKREAPTAIFGQEFFNNRHNFYEQ